MIHFILGIAVATIICYLIHSSIEKKQKTQLSARNKIILELTNISKKLMPENPCMMMSTTTELYCMKPASHFYAGLGICENCARKLIENGANPSPELIK